VYRAEGDRFVPVEVLGPSTPTWSGGPGTWVVSAVSRVGAESAGVRVTVDHP
jgi:hypothetical protein